MPPALRRRRDYTGPILFSYGFRPFFFLGALWAALSILLWLPQYFGEWPLPTAFAPLDWHVHEMLYGYVAAIVTGFLLTAIPNWTGRLPVNGWPLAGLCALWLTGRIVIAGSSIWGIWFAAVVDLAFLTVLAAVAAREIVAGRNWRNLRVLVILGILIIGNVMFHLEVIEHGRADYGIRIGIAAAIGLITLIGGRIVPSFTHNWLARNNSGRLPRPFSRFDALALGVTALALIIWIGMPQQTLSAIALMIAGVLQAARLTRWAGDRAFAERLVLILHIGYAFVPIGFVLLAAAILWPSQVPPSAGLHAWTAGAIGLMTLAVMTRASLGHTGHKLVASLPTQLLYLSLLIAALVRILAAFEPSSTLLHVAAITWVVAFGGFAIVFGPLLIGRSAAHPRHR